MYTKQYSLEFRSFPLAEDAQGVADVVAGFWIVVTKFSMMVTGAWIPDAEIPNGDRWANPDLVGTTLMDALATAKGSRDRVSWCPLTDGAPAAFLLPCFSPQLADWFWFGSWHPSAQARQFVAMAALRRPFDDLFHFFFLFSPPSRSSQLFLLLS